MLYRLIILNGERRSERITVTQAPMTIGRDETCEIRFNDPEIALSHAEISHAPEGLFIRDLGSMNRLLVNNHEVRETHPKHGDVVEVGHTRFLVQAYVQAEVQGEESGPYRRKPWIMAGGALLVIIGLLTALYRCAPAAHVKPAARVKPASAAKPAPARLAHAAPTNAAPPPPAPILTPSQTTTNVKQVTATPARIAVPEMLPEETSQVDLVISKSTETSPAPEIVEAALLMAKPDTNSAAEVIAVAQKELEEAANALLESKVKEMLEEARNLAASNGPAAAEPLLASIEKISPDFMEASVTHAAMLENQGKLEPALALWNDILRRSQNTPYAAQAEKKSRQLARARTEMVFPFVGRIKIVDTSISKFPETEQYREMRLLNIRLVATEFQKEIDADAVRIEVRFYDQSRQTGEIEPTTAKVPATALTVSGPWRATVEKTVEASYVVPATGVPIERPGQYHGFIVRIYYYGALQDERVQPRDLPADVELAIPDVVPATNQPPVASTNVNVS